MMTVTAWMPHEPIWAASAAWVSDVPSAPVP